MREDIKQAILNAIDIGEVTRHINQGKIYYLTQRFLDHVAEQYHVEKAEIMTMIAEHFQGLIGFYAQDPKAPGGRGVFSPEQRSILRAWYDQSSDRVTPFQVYSGPYLKKDDYPVLLAKLMLDDTPQHRKQLANWVRNHRVETGYQHARRIFTPAAQASTTRTATPPPSPELSIMDDVTPEEYSKLREATPFEERGRGRSDDDASEAPPAKSHKR